MRKYSPVIGLMAIIAAMMILQVGTQEVGASSALISSQSNQMDRPAIGGGPLMAPMDQRLVKGDDAGSGDNKKVEVTEEKSDTPDVRTVDWSKTASVDKKDGNGNGDDEDESGDEDKEGDDKDKKDEGGGFDRLWDVISNG